MSFEALYDLYKQDVFQYLFRLTGSRDEAEELTAETFYRAFVRFSTFRGDSDVKTWLYAIARHAFYQQLSRQKRTLSVEEETLGRLCTQAGLIHPDVAENTLLGELVNRLLAQKDKRSRTVFRMRLDGYSFKEIGQHVGLSESSARVVEYRTRIFLQQALRKEGYDSE